MPPDTNNVHAILGEHEAKLEGHRRELDGLWRGQAEDRERLVKVRIQVAVIVAVGMILGGLLQAMSNRYAVSAVEKLINQERSR